MESDKKLTSLDNEVKIVKGEVKSLLIDIREIMNNMENPFHNIRSIPDGPDTPPDTRMRGEDAPMSGISPEDMFKQEPQPELVEMPVQEEEMQQMDTGPAPDVAGQAETPDHVPDFTEMFRQYEEAKQSGGNGAGQAETPGHAPDFTEMPVQDEIPEPVPDFARMPVQHEGAKQSEGMPEETLEIQPDNGFDIHTLTELMRWADYTLATIERGKLDELLDLCVLTGHISETLKDIISKITDLSTQEIAEGSTPTMQDHISAIFQLNAVLNPSESDRKAIYSIYGELPWRTVT